VSLYKVHFKWKNKEIQLTARKLDLTHPYFVSIKDIVFPEKSSLIINPAQEDILKDFGEADHVMIPFQTVLLIEEYPEEKRGDKVRQFKILEDKKGEGK